MFSKITAIIISIVGFLCDKVRDCVADKLKDDDSTDERILTMVVKDAMTNIQILPRSNQYLMASYSFLKEGLEWLNLALDQSKKDQTTPRGTTLSLPQEIQCLKTSSNMRFASAQDCFKDSRKTATHAFNNESLSIKDRIMACKLRVAASILELGLEDPPAAITACLASLNELSKLSAVHGKFAFIPRILRPNTYQPKRSEQEKSVLFIKRFLDDFASKYSSKPPKALTWPRMNSQKKAENIRQDWKSAEGTLFVPTEKLRTTEKPKSPICQSVIPLHKSFLLPSSVFSVDLPEREIKGSKSLSGRSCKGSIWPGNDFRNRVFNSVASII